ncbi:MAG: hypothetical protein WBQ75_07670 [Acetobacteraceae bacterium]
MSDENGDSSRRGALVALVVVAVLIVGALLLARELHRNAALQDCVMSGRRDCALIQPGTGR